MLRAPLSELARNPDHERIAFGLGSGGTLRRRPVLPAASAEEGRNGAAAAPEQGRTQLRPPTPRQLAGWKAIQQVQPQRCRGILQRTRRD